MSLYYLWIMLGYDMEPEKLHVVISDDVDSELIKLIDEKVISVDDEIEKELDMLIEHCKDIPVDETETIYVPDVSDILIDQVAYNKKKKKHKRRK